MAPLGHHYRPLKRTTDIVVSGAGIVALAPVFLGVYLVVRLSMGRPVLFRQVRLGRDEEPFTIFKFRTMSAEFDSTGAALPDRARTTRAGAFLRRSSLDELPELVNVLRGDMSLVGPRPLLPRYGPFFTELERMRFTVRPGITGLAQVSGRNSASWNERLESDIRYVQTMSMGTDLAILRWTVISVLRGLDVQVNPGAVMEDLDEERAGDRASQS